MPFIFIKDRFEPEVGPPDGDSVRFLASNPAPWEKLNGTRLSLGISDTSKNITQAPPLKGIEAIKTTTSKMNWLMTPFLCPDPPHFIPHLLRDKVTQQPTIYSHPMEE